MQAKKPATAHSFNSPASEAVLSLHQLLVKVISAKELPRSSTAQRRNCSVEVTLVGSGGATIEGGMHSRTGPPNHFSTVKDTAPVWNAEFVSEVSAELLSGANLRLDVWDDATSPPVHMGAALLEEDALRELRNRDEERSLPIRPEHAGSAPGGGGGALRLRVALVDVRNALASLPEAEAKATQAQQRVDTAEREQAGVRVGMRLLTGALQEEESHVAVLRQSTPGTHSGVSSQAPAALARPSPPSPALPLPPSLPLCHASLPPPHHVPPPHTSRLHSYPCPSPLPSTLIFTPTLTLTFTLGRSEWTHGWSRRRRTPRWWWRQCATRRSRRWGRSWACTPAR
jgi:hypothetical protein